MRIYFKRWFDSDMWQAINYDFNDEPETIKGILLWNSLKEAADFARQNYVSVLDHESTHYIDLNPIIRKYKDKIQNIIKDENPEHFMINKIAKNLKKRLNFRKHSTAWQVHEDDFGVLLNRLEEYK